MAPVMFTEKKQAGSGIGSRAEIGPGVEIGEEAEVGPGAEIGSES